MARVAKKSKSELEERLKTLQREQKRLAKEISSLSRGSVASVGSAPARKPSKSRSSRTAKPSRAGGSSMKAYLSNGSFRATRKLRHERAVQRNKAIFMLVVAVVSMYMFLAWIF